MNWNEALIFTWSDSSSFTWDVLTLDKYEFIAKAENGSIQLPTDVQEKLRSLCTELAEKVPEKKTFFSGISVKTVGDVAKVFLTLVQIAKGLDDINIGLRVKQICDIIQSLL